MLLLSALLARILGPEDFGFYSLFFGVYIVLFQAFSGINIAYVRAVQSGQSSETHTLKLSLVLQAALSFIVVLLGWPLSQLIGKALSLPSAFHLYMGFVTAGLIGLFAVWFGYFQARRNFIKLGFATFIYNFVILCVVSLCLLFGMTLTVDQIILAHVVAALCFAVPSALIIFKNSTNIRISRDGLFDFSRMATLNIAVTSLYFLYRYIDIYFIQYFLGAPEVGVYSAAMKTSMLLSILVGSLPTILLPRVIRSVTSSKDTLAYLRTAYTITFGIVALLAIFWVLAPLFLRLLFGEEYSQGDSILRWLVIGWIFNALYIPVAQIFYGLNKLGWRLFLEFVKLLVTAVGMMLLIPQYGAVGAAYAIVIATLCTFLISIPLSFGLLRGSYNQSE